MTMNHKFIDLEKYIKEQILNGKSQTFVTDEDGDFLKESEVEDKLDQEIVHLSTSELIQFISDYLKENYHAK